MYTNSVGFLRRGQNQGDSPLLLLWRHLLSRANYENATIGWRAEESQLPTVEGMTLLASKRRRTQGAGIASRWRKTRKKSPG